MIPTPSTSHVSFDKVYEPAEDSFLFLDTLSDPKETTWLHGRFGDTSSSGPPTGKLNSSPIILEVGSGSGVILGFVVAHSNVILGRRDVLALGTDVNYDACLATRKTVLVATTENLGTDRILESSNRKGVDCGLANPLGLMDTLAVITGDLYTPFRPGIIDILLFNPPYVPTAELPPIPTGDSEEQKEVSKDKPLSDFETQSYLLSLSYAGGELGMETTNRFLESIPCVLNPERGVAYVLLCAQNKPLEVVERVCGWGSGWTAEIVGRSGMKAGWERLVVVRIWRE